jgi:putative heme-binding domain-containing protein
MVATSANPLARLHALWTLDGLGALDDATIAAAMGDAAPGVRENAVRLAEPRLRGSTPLASRLVRLAASETDARVRLGVLGALGSLTTADAAAARRALLFAHLDDRWMQAAALSAGSDQAPALLDTVLGGRAGQLSVASETRAGLIRQLASIVGARQQAAEIRRVIDAVAAARRTDAAWWRAAALEGLAEGARGRESARTTVAAARPALLALFAETAAPVRAGALRVLRLAGPGEDAAWSAAVQRAVRAAEGKLDAQRRADAVALVALDRPERRADWFARFVAPHEPEAVQIAAVTALGRVGAADLGPFLLARWPAFTPGVRSQAAEVLIADAARARLLVAALKAGKVPAWSLGFWQKQDLVLHDDPAVRAAARAVLEEDPQQRAATVQRYAAALDLAGDPGRGAEVFARACTQCHRLGATPGGDLGPDLATVRQRPPMSLLADILLPSRSIAQRYETYMVERRNGGWVSGLLGAETPTAISIRQGGEQTLVVPRADIASMEVSPVSVMPADLDAVVSPAEMADLLAYMRR